VFAIIAFSGVVLASVYALRMFIRAMHNRVGPEVVSREMSVRDGLVLVPLVLVIIAFALYPQIALNKGEAAVTRSIGPAQQVQQATASERAEVRHP
jgi:NADH-quinone oxidoreductase subunit M